jgi:hypothetical protein
MKSDRSDRLIEMLEKSVDGIKLMKDEVAKQTVQMEEMRNEINAIKSTLSNQAPPKEINIDEMSTKLSELTDSNKTLKEEVAGVSQVLEEIQTKIREPPPHPSPKQSESVEKIKTVVTKMETKLLEVREDTACSADIQKFQTGQLDALAKEVKYMIDFEEEILEKLQMLEGLARSSEAVPDSGEFSEMRGSLSTQAMNQIHNAVADALEPIVLKTRELPSRLSDIIDEYSNTAVIRCMMNFGTLRDMVQESRRWGDNEDISIQGHNHAEIPPINKLSMEEATRLLHKSPEFAGMDEEHQAEQCSKCGETAIPSLMRGCDFCSRQYHKSCHEPAYFQTHNKVDLRMCRPCRDSIHLEQITENLSKCANCRDFVEKQKKLLEEHSKYLEDNHKVEDESLMRDMAGGNEIWQNILNDIERNTTFVMSRMLQEDDPEESESTPKKTPLDPPTASTPSKQPTKIQSPNWKIGQSGFLSSPHLAKAKEKARLLPRNSTPPPTLNDRPNKTENFNKAPSEEKANSQATPDQVTQCTNPTTPEKGDPTNTSCAETPTIRGSSSEDMSSEDDSVVKKEERKARRSLRPVAQINYNLRARGGSSGFGAIPEGEDGNGSDGEEEIPMSVLRD